MVDATKVLSNGHQVERLLYEIVCATIKVISTIRLPVPSNNPERQWFGKESLRDLWIVCVDKSQSKMTAGHCLLLARFGLCDCTTGNTTENIRNIILSLTYVNSDNDIIMIVPSIRSTIGLVDPIPAQIEINLGQAPKF